MFARGIEPRGADWPARMEDRALQSRKKGLAEHILFVPAAFELRSLHRQLDPSLRIQIEEAARGGCELAGVRALCLSTRATSLYERKDGNGRDENET
jgi:hypothetical protein